MVWHATVVAGAMGRLTGAVTESMAPTGTDQTVWDDEVRDLTRAANLASRGTGPEASSLLLDVLGELHHMTGPVPRDFGMVNLPVALLRELGKERAAASTPAPRIDRRLQA